MAPLSRKMIKAAKRKYPLASAGLEALLSDDDDDDAPVAVAKRASPTTSSSVAARKKAGGGGTTGGRGGGGGKLAKGSRSHLKPLFERGDEVYAAWWPNAKARRDKNAEWFPGVVKSYSEVETQSPYGPTRFYDVEFDGERVVRV